MVLFRSAALLLLKGPSAVVLRAVSYVLAAATAPLAVELLALTAGALLPKRREQKGIHPVGPAPLQPLTVVVPAHNEQELVGRCVQSLSEDLPSGSSVLVVAHNCTDRTAEKAEDSGADVILLEDEGRQGKGAALRAGFRQAVANGARVLAVVDADSVVAPGFSSAISNALDHGAEAFQARYVVMGGENQASSRLTALGFLGFNVIRPRGRSRLGLSAGIFGNGFGFRSSVLEQIPYKSSSLVEDLEYHLRLVEGGVRVHFLPDATVASEMPQNATAASSQRARWEGGRLRTARVWLPRLLWETLKGRASLLEPAIDLASLPLASEVALLTICVALPVPWLRIYGIAVIGIVAAHVSAAAAEGSGWRNAARTLLHVPRYILWKFRMLPRTLASSRPDAAWIRTSREEVAARPATITSIDRGRSVDLRATGSGKRRP